VHIFLLFDEKLGTSLSVTMVTDLKKPSPGTHGGKLCIAIRT